VGIGCSLSNLERPLLSQLSDGFSHFAPKQFQPFFRAARAQTNQHNFCYKCPTKWGCHMGTIGWLLVWLIVNALFVVWRVLVVSPQLKTTDQSVREAAGTL
jgi:hypothetical protein